MEYSNPILIIPAVGYAFQLNDINLMLSATWTGKTIKNDWQQRGAVDLEISDGIFFKIHDDLELYTATFKTFQKRAAPLGPEVPV